MRRELARCLKVAREMHSLRSDALYRLSLAQHLRHRVFWLPHNMDHRGRTYPCPPHFITWAVTWHAPCWSLPRAARSAPTASTGSRSTW